MSAADQPSRLPRWAKALIWLIVIAVAVVVLFRWVFPWVEEQTQDPTLGLVPAVVVGAR